MAIFKGSRYEDGKFTALKTSAGKVKKFVHPRYGYSSALLANGSSLVNLKEGELFDEIMFEISGKEEDWWVLAEANDVFFALDLTGINRIIIP